MMKDSSTSHSLGGITKFTKRSTFVSTMLKFAAIGLVAGLSLFDSQTAGAETPKRGGTLVIGHGSIRHLNPAVQSGSATGVPGTQIFASLVQLDENFKVKPYLAESWSISVNVLTYTIKLVKGVTFHDGKPVTSADVA